MGRCTDLDALDDGLVEGRALPPVSGGAAVQPRVLQRLPRRRALLGVPAVMHASHIKLCCIGPCCMHGCDVRCMLCTSSCAASAVEVALLLRHGAVQEVGSPVASA